MPIIRAPQIQQQRGMQGQQRFNVGRGYNFANLYQMNKSNGLQDKAQNLQSQAESANSQMADQVKKAQGAQFDQNQVNYAMNKAKDVSNQAQNFSVQNQAMKQGSSPYQAGILGFYSGVSNPYINQIRSFSNTYNTALGRNAEIQRLRAPGSQAGQPVKPNLPPKTGDDGFRSQAQAQALTRSPNNTNNLNYLDDLTWALKTGRITGQEYYAAQGGPGTPGFDKVKGKLR